MKLPIIGTVGLGGRSVFLNVNHFHMPGETVHADSIYDEPGGKAYNQAVAARVVGAEVKFFGCFGYDNDGKVCEDYLLDKGIEPIIQVSKETGTAYACILTDERGENRVTVFTGASNCLSSEFIREKEDKIKECDALILGLECPLEATLEAFHIAKENGKMVIFNPAPVRDVPDELLAGADYITPNEQEAKALLGESFERMTEIGVKNMIVTLGSKGAMLINESGRHMYSGKKVEAVDTTGAGDAFNGALAVALCRGDSVDDAIRFAIDISAKSVQYRHVMESYERI